MKKKIRKNKLFHIKIIKFSNKKLKHTRIKDKNHNHQLLENLDHILILIYTYQISLKHLLNKSKRISIVK